MTSSSLQKSDVPVFPNLPSPALNGYDSSTRHSYPPTRSILPADQQLPRKSQTSLSKIIVVVIGALLLILASLAIVLPIVITQTKSQPGGIESPLTLREDFETTSSLNSFRQSVIQRSPESGKRDATTQSLLERAKTNSETSISSVHLQTSESLFRFQSSAESIDRTTTKEKSGHSTATQKSVTSKQSQNDQTSRTFYESSTSSRQYSSTVSACQVFCSPTQSCIPPNQVCDKTQDCPDDSDEINCNCDANHYPCQNGRCVYKSWLCDGVRDCPMGDDESTSRCGSCNISTDYFRCNRPLPVCVASNKQCDGVSDCVDSSDESHCINVFNEETDSSNASLLNVTFQGISGYYICSENWNNTLSDSICRQMGQEQSKTTIYETVKNNATQFLSLNSSVSSSNPLDYLRPSVCSSNEAVAINCQPPVCGSRSSSLGSIGPYILNGQQAMRGAWPWFALLQQGVYSVGGAFSQTASCGGVLINSRWILTAAHCNVVATSNLGYSGKLKPENIQISLGVVSRSGSNDSLNARVDRVFVHPLYNTTPSTINDVGLLRLTAPVNFTDTIRPICLPSPLEDLGQIRVCVDTGFGRTLRNEPSNKLLQARMNILSYSDCYNYLKNTFVKDQSQFCAGTLPSEADINFCTGDSGGPLSCQDQKGTWKVIGINSYVLGQNNNRAVDTCVVSVASRVTYFLDWIQQTMAQNSA